MKRAARQDQRSNRTGSAARRRPGRRALHDDRARSSNFCNVSADADRRTEAEQLSLPVWYSTAAYDSEKFQELTGFSCFCETTPGLQFIVIEIGPHVGYAKNKVGLEPCSMKEKFERKFLRRDLFRFAIAGTGSALIGSQAPEPAFAQSVDLNSKRRARYQAELRRSP